MSETDVKILVIEDEPLVRESLKDSLEGEGYMVRACEDGVVGLDTFEDYEPNLVLLDLMMPGMDGLEVCRRVRRINSNIPIIMLTAKSTEIDKVVGLEIGADDYLTKPFGMRELFARVKARLRRSSMYREGSEESLKLEFDDVSIDFKTYRASKGEKEVEFSAKEFELLRYLATNIDVPVSRAQLLDEVWGYNSFPTTRTVDNFVARIRQKIECIPDKPKHLITVYGVGYKLVL